MTQALVARGVTPGLAVVIVGDNPASKVYVANKVKACNEVGLQSTVYAFQRRDARHRGRGRDPPPQCRSGRARHPGAAAPACALRRPAGAGGDFQRQGCGRLSSLQRGRAGAGRNPVPALHAFRCAEDAGVREHPDRGAERGGGGCQQHRGQTHGPDAHAQGRHGVHLPRQDARPGAVHDPGRHPGGGRRQAEPDPATDGAHRGGGDRRGHQPAARRPAGGGCGLRGRAAEGVLHQARCRAGWGR